MANSPVVADGVTEVFTTDDFDLEVVEAKIPVLVDFYAVWCGPCKTIAPHLKKLAKEFDGRIKVVKVNVDKNPTLTDAYNVKAMPTFMLFSEGKIVAEGAGASVPRLWEWANKWSPKVAV